MFGFRWLALIAVGLIVAIVAAAGLRSLMDDGDDGRSHALEVTAASFEPWPFTVDRGTLECLDGQSITLRVPDGTRYGLNGTAQTAGHLAPEPVWLEDPEVEGLRVDMGTALAWGQALCR